MNVPSSPAGWLIRSSMPGRLRLVCSDLIESSLLRHHCAVTLTSCQWIKGFRINRLNGSLVLLFPQHRQKDLDSLLEQSLTFLGLDSEHHLLLAGLRAYEWRLSPVSSQALRHGLNVGMLLLAEVLLPIPAAVMIAGALLALMPIGREVWHQWRHTRQLPPETVELAFSGLLLSQGHAGEALLDLVLGDSTDAIAGMAAGESELHAKPREFFDHISSAMSIELADEHRSRCMLKDARLGDRYHVNVHTHVFLTSSIVEGEIIVINRLYDGDWRPQRIGPGETARAGALVIKGQAVAEVKKEINDHINFLQAVNTQRSGLHKARLEERLEAFEAAMTPILLGAGALLFGIGAAERALGLLQFTPIDSWKTTKTSSRLTAMSSLGLQGVQVNNADALLSIGKARHIVISRSCLDRMGGIKTREHLQPDSALKKGDLLRILAGIQNHLLATDEIRIWSDQLNHIPDPIKIKSLHIGNLLAEGWQITLDDGRELTLNEQQQPPDHVPQTHMDPLEIWENGNLLGYVELITKPAGSWIGVCEALDSLGVDVHVVGNESQSRMLELVQPLGIRHETHLYGGFNAADRLELVRDLQREGAGVVYLGYLLCDMPALTLSDVSISIDVDFDSAVTGSICDICLGADAHWLPRIIELSRGLETTEASNFALIAGSSLLTAVAATAAWIAPLPTVLLTNIPIFLAELRNIQAMRRDYCQGPRAQPPRSLPHLLSAGLA